MSLDDALGGQTLTNYERVRGEHRQYRDGVSTVHPGVSLQPAGARDETVDGRSRGAARWKLFAPAGFRAASTDQCTVSPGPVDDDGAPARLAYDGTPEAHYDLDGAEDHVTAVLTLVASNKTNRA